MNNPRITPKDRNLIKGAIRRVFSRSELRRLTIDKSRIEHQDPNRLRVKKWSMCPECKTPTPTYQMEADHVDPIIPLDKSMEDMTWDEVINRIYCILDNLRAVCKTCHKAKSKGEAKKRKELRRDK